MCGIQREREGKRERERERERERSSLDAMYCYLESSDSVPPFTDTESQILLERQITC